ncbi:MAG: RecQ family ATP-dependent DNA helicase [Treponema sp.]
MEKMKEPLEKAAAVLKNVFGYSEFRPMQKEIIASVLSGRDTLAVMPTGGGKSLCYQIPALLFVGITIVISPLISLMQDQVSSLLENGVNALFLNSALDWDDYIDAVRRIKSGEAKLVYLSPEALATQRVQDILHECSVPVRCITVDEAHCVSEWGHDFRPDYMEISSVRRQFKGVVCLALTATATSHVREDIASNLRMNEPEIFIAGFNRANIFLEVRQKRDALFEVKECLEKHKGESGIIYCFSRKQVDKLTEQLRGLGYSVMNYHAGLSDAERAEHQTQFIRDKARIMVATLAFGMGIDKPNVRFVIHYDLPKSLEEYYQEIGRAGRDGLASHALLLYNASDAHKIRYFFEESSDSGNSERLLQAMLGYASARTCRRHFLLSYFGERYIPSSLAAKGGVSPVDKDEDGLTGNTAPSNQPDFPCCDICNSSGIPLEDVTVPAQKFMSCIYRTKSRYGAAYVIDVLLGSKQKRILENRHHEISTWGIGKELSKDDWFTLSDSLLIAGFIEKYGDYNVLKVTAAGKQALAARAKIELPVELSKQRVLNQVQMKKSFVVHKKGEFLRSLGEADTALYEAIKEWRQRTAEEENVPPYIIFGDKTIEELVLKKPHTERELLGVFGIGEVKAEKFGPALLRMLEDSEEA